MDFGVVIIGNIEKYIMDIVFEMGWKFDMFNVVWIDKKVVIIGVGLVGFVVVDILVCNGV